jgi:hypothetical protein
MPTSVKNVAKLYSSVTEHESTRLANHSMEHEHALRTVRHGLGSMLTASAVRRIANVSGGPGKLAFALADDGHHVDLVDLSPDLIRLPQSEQSHRGSTGSGAVLASIMVGNALNDPPCPVADGGVLRRRPASRSTLSSP